MCMLLVKPKGVTLPPEYFKSLWNLNPDGLVTYNPSTKELFKSLSEDESFEHLNTLHDDEVVVHFRLGTSGETSLDQVHGFSVCMDEWLLFHNGVLASVSGVDGLGLSDTQVLVKLFQDKTANELVIYLEEHEKWDRFLLVSKITGEMIKPKCGKWTGKATIDGVEVIFSNNTAINPRLLDDKKNEKKADVNWWKDELSKTTSKYKPTIADQVVSDRDYVDMVELVWKNKSEAIKMIQEKPHVAFKLLDDHFGFDNDLPF